MKILIIQTAFLGDVILSLPMVRALKKNMPESILHYLCIPHTAEVLQNNPSINSIIAYDKHNTGLREFFRIAKRIREENYDVTICPHRSYRSGLLTHLSGAKVRVGFDINPFSFLLTDLVAYDVHKHEIERNLELLTPVSFPRKRESSGMQSESEIEFLKPRLFPSPSDKDVVDKLLKFINGKNKLIAFAPCSKWFTKQIPLPKAREIIYNLLGAGFKVILIGGNEDAEYCRLLKNDIPDERLVNFCARLTPLQSAYLISNMQLLITTDSAAMHLGASTDTPIIAVYGSTDPGFGFYPLTSKHEIIEVNGLECRPCTDHGRTKCPLGHFKCMNGIRPVEILNAAKSVF